MIEADISSVQRLANTPIEVLTKIEGLGEKTAENLIEKASAFALLLEKEYDKKQKELAKEKAEQEEESDEAMTAEDVFVDEEEEYVTEVDDQQKAVAPDFEDIEDE